MNDNQDRSRQGGSAGQAAPGDRRGHADGSRQHRFRKGQTGNPRGKRKGTQNLLTVFKQVVRKKVKVRFAGEQYKMTIADYVLRANYDAALKGNQKAINNMLLVAEVAGHLLSAEDRERIGAPITHSQALATEDFEALFVSPVPDGTSGSKH
jgi:Family of unknown function (DUF5681)